ncbi:MAG: hypothetical protein ACKPIC_15375, partial [Microcystis panniformis]
LVLPRLVLVYGSGGLKGIIFSIPAQTERPRRFCWAVPLAPPKTDFGHDQTSYNICDFLGKGFFSHRQ